MSSRAPTLDHCIIVVTPVPFRDTQGPGESPVFVLGSLSRFTGDRLENDSSMVLLSRRFFFIVVVCFFLREEWRSCSSEIYVPVTTLRHSAGQSIFDWALRCWGLLSRRLCWRGLGGKKERCFNHLITPLSLCLCDNTINKHRLSCTLPKINM